MIQLPTGTVTFLFTDIEGSSRLAQEHPNQWEALRARHNAILQSVMDAHAGYVFQIVGDSFCVAFHSAGEALAAAWEAQTQLQQEPWSPVALKVRMGIHTGAAQLNPTTTPIAYTGYTTLVLVQRLMSAGHGGQVLLSGSSAALVQEDLPPGVELLDLGERRLKDLQRPVHLYQLHAPGLATSFRPLKTLDTSLHNLPVQLTTFIGREQQIAEVKQAIRVHPLVTLIGPGGTGKTRLSLRVAADLIDQYPHGVWFIELAPLTDPDLIPQTILTSIGITEQSGRPLDGLRAYLRQKQALIVLDNCEHLIEACAHLAHSLLAAAPDLKILASSREALSVPGEVSYPVPSLSLPDVQQQPRIEDLSQFEAVRLFLDRARLADLHFTVDASNGSFVAEVCQRLDGIPLAIELAAARVRMLSVQEILSGLDDRFNLLTGGARTLLPRQQTLRALIDWSYELLSEPERIFFRRLSVFAGGWTSDAARAVCFPEADRQPFDVPDLLTQLVNKSLVVILGDASGKEKRYTMLETIRQYGRERLAESEGMADTRRRHLTYFLHLSVQAGPELYQSDQAFWFNRLNEELDNLRLALEWALQTDLPAGLQMMAGPIYRFWIFRSTSRELGNWLAQLLARDPADSPLRSRAMAIQSQCIGNTEGNFGEAHRLAEASLQMARRLGDRPAEAFSLSILGGFVLLQGNVGEALPVLEQALDLFRALGDKIGQAMTIDWLAINNPNLERSTAYARQGLQLCRELGDQTGVASILTTLARLTYAQGDVNSPVPWLEEVLAIARQLGDQVRETEALITYGTLVYWQGDYVRARALYEEGLHLGDKIGYHYQNLWAQIYLAYAVLRQGDLPGARDYFVMGMRDLQKAGLLIGLVFAVEGVASLSVAQAELRRAARLFAWADAMRSRLADPRPPIEQSSVERDYAVIRSRLSEAELVLLMNDGKELTLDEALGLALEE